jgi:diacylglycerol kinase
VNIAIERLVDIMKPRIHHYAGVVKDATAAAVLVASLGALVVGLVIFIPYILEAFAS